MAAASEDSSSLAGALSSEHFSETLNIVCGELARFDLETVVPISMPEPFEDVAPDGEMTRLPLIHDMTVFMHHQSRVFEEVFGASSQIDASPASGCSCIPVQAGQPGVFDHFDIPNPIAEETGESESNGLRHRCDLSQKLRRSVGLRIV